MFGHAAKPSKIYRYHAKVPETHLELIMAQLRGAHDYRNRLVALERQRRDEVEALLQADEVYAILHRAAQYADMGINISEAQIASRNATMRQRSATAADRQWLKAQRVVRKAFYDEARQRRRALFADPGIQHEIEALDAHINIEQKRLRAASGIFWGSYLVIEQGLSGMRSGPPPRFHRWDGTGKLAVQLQRGLTPAALFSQQDRRIRVRPLPPEAWAADHVRHALRRTVAWMRIGSEGRDPVFAEIPFVMHRQLPKDGKIKWVYLVKERVGTHDRWWLEFVVAREDGYPHDDAATMGMVGVDLGWRLVDEGLRIAYWVGDDGQEGSLVLPQDLLARQQKVEDLRSIRDEDFDAMRMGLWIWLQDASSLPDWLRERTASLRQWKSPARLAALVLFWRGERFSGDAAMMEDLEAWRRHDRHLYDWQEAQRQAVIRERNERYRRFAAQLRRRYAMARIEDTDWRRLRRRPMPEEEAPPGAVRHYQMLAAPGLLREIIKASMAAHEIVPTRHSTQGCSMCGALMGQDASVLQIRCPGCRTLHDQDANAARIHLQGGFHADHEKSS